MPNKEELAHQATVQQLRQLAEQNDLDLGDATTKEEIAKAVTESRKVSKEDLERVVGNGSSSSSKTSASPTGDENVAGTPQSQLQQAPPMDDQSGSNIPAPNLRQPLAGGVRSTEPSTSPDSLDRQLTDPEGAARERAEGRTSDAAMRSADARAADTTPDLNDGPKQSDAGPEQYPFPTAGDVDVATVKAGKGKGEFLAPLELEDWVVLGKHKLVPERLVGHRAVVTDAPRHLVAVADKGRTWITVRTRDEADATLTIPLDAVAEIQRGGASPLVRG